MIPLPGPIFVPAILFENIQNLIFLLPEIQFLKQEERLKNGNNV